MDPHNDFDKHDRSPFDIAPATNTPYREVVKQRDALLAALKATVDQFGPWHDDDCPADDTCGCSAKQIHDQVNAAITEAESKPAGRAQRRKP